MFAIETKIQVCGTMIGGIGIMIRVGFGVLSRYLCGPCRNVATVQKSLRHIVLEVFLGGLSQVCVDLYHTVEMCFGGCVVGDRLFSCCPKA